MIAFPLIGPLIAADLQDVIVVNARVAVIGDDRVHRAAVIWALGYEMEP